MEGGGGIHKSVCVRQIPGGTSMGDTCAEVGPMFVFAVSVCHHQPCHTNVESMVS